MSNKRIPDKQEATQSVGIRSIAYNVGESVPIETLTCMERDSTLLARFKREFFKNFSRSTVSLAEQAIISAKETLCKSGLTASDLDAVVIGSSELNSWPGYPESLSTAILKGLSLNRLPVVGVTLAGCANAASSLRIARNMIRAEGYRNVLVIETNQLHDDDARLVGAAPDDIPCNVFGDGAVSFIVCSEDAEFDVLSMTQFVSMNEASNPNKHDLLAKHISSGRHVIDDALDSAELSREQIDCALLSNMNFKMMLGTLNAFGFPKTKFFTDNIERHGHVWSADNFINLHDYCVKKSPPAGTHFLLFSQGSNFYSAVICRKNFT